MVDELWSFMATGGTITNPAILCQESMRILTYASWPQNSKLFPSLLASAGFYYAGHDEEVICFSCGGRISEWPIEYTPMELHKKKFPHCLFARGIDGNNQPLQGGAPGNNVLAGLGQIQPMDTTRQPQSLPFSESNNNFMGDLFQSLPPYSSVPGVGGPSIPDSRISTGSSQQNARTSRSEQSVGFNFTNRSAETERPWDDNVPVRYREQPLTSYNDKKTEMGRLATFVGWPMNANVTPADLAKAGFFYTGVSDNVECAYCGGGLCNWEPGDRPIVEHRDNFPSCRFIQELERNTSNMTSSPAGVPLPAMSAAQPATSTVGGVTSRGSPHNLQEMGVIDAVQHQYPEYAVLMTRLNSYTSWDPSHHLKPEQLSHAGFYYTGDNDNVLCFSCGGGLRNWEAGDDPWAEHARWFPRCSFLRQQKGDAFIEEIRQRHAQQEVTSMNDVPVGVSEEPVIPAVPATAEEQRNTGTITVGNDDRITNMLKSKVVESVMSMGFTEDRIKKVLERNLTSWASKIPSLDVLLDAIFNENGESNESTDMDTSPSETAPTRTQPPQRMTEYEPGAKPRLAANIPQTNQGASSLEMLRRQIEEERETQVELEQEEAKLDTETVELQRQIADLKERNKCKICMDEEIAIVFLPCGHLVACATCAAALKKCPMCRTVIKGTVHTYLA